MCLKTSVKSVFYWRKPTLLCPQQEQRHRLIGENVKEFKRAVECLSPPTWAYRPIRFQWWYVCLKKKKIGLQTSSLLYVCPWHIISSVLIFTQNAPRSTYRLWFVWLHYPLAIKPRPRIWGQQFTCLVWCEETSQIRDETKSVQFPTLKLKECFWFTEL